MLFKRGDVVRNIVSGKYWAFEQPCYWDKSTCFLKPVPERLGLPTGKRQTRALRVNLRLASKGEIDRGRETQKEDETMEKIYEFNHAGDAYYGTYMATNRAGLWVMDVKGSPPLAVPKSACKEVIPYSVKVRTLLENSNDFHATVEKGSVEKGKVYITKSGGLYLVLELDTETKTGRSLEPVAEVLTKSL